MDRALKIFSDSAGLYPMRVVDDADADDEDEAWEPGRPSMMDLGDDEQEQAAKAKRKLKRRSRRTGPAPAAAAALRPLPKIRVFPQLSEVQKARLRMKDQEHIRRGAPQAVTQEQERNAFLERIQAEEVRREQARIAAARPRLQRLFPNLDFRLSWSVRFNVVVQTIDAIAPTRTSSSASTWRSAAPVGVYEDSLACQLLGQTYVHPDKTIKITVDLVVTSEVIGVQRPRRRRDQELGFHFIDPLAPIAEKEIVPRVRVFIRTSASRLDQHHVAARVLLDAPRLRSTRRASPDAPWTPQAEGEYQLALSNYRQMELWCFFKATLVADGAKKVSFHYQNQANGQRIQYLPECGVRYPYGSKLGLFKGRVGGGVRDFERFASFSSEPRRGDSAFDSTPRRAKLPRALVLRLLRLGPVRRAAEFPNLLKALATVDVNDMETLRARARRTTASFSQNVFRERAREIEGLAPGERLERKNRIAGGADAASKPSSTLKPVSA
ncbi:hypothetical protein JL722_3653 [Aureococcus anophagefferens]|nr:hypothetical protein JL722_3653 [Aureococcus anophagefferens]